MIADGLHDESPISFRDVNIIKQAFVERLRTMYHARVLHPELKKRRYGRLMSDHRNLRIILTGVSAWIFLRTRVFI